MSFVVVCRDDDPQWLDERRSLVTGSVAPHLLGVGRYGSLLGAYLYMRGSSGGDATADPETLAWGHDQQASIVRALSRRLGLPAVNENALVRSTQYPWMGATLDGWVEVDGGRKPIEIKTCRSVDLAKIWEDRVPPEVVAQVQHGLAVTAEDRTLVGVTLFGAPPVFQWVERDDAVTEQLIQKSRAFYDDVQAGRPPAPRGSDDEGPLLDGLPMEEGAEIDLDIEAVVLNEDLDAITQRISDLEERRKSMLNAAKLKMRGAQIGRLPGGGRWKLTPITRKGFIRVTGGASLMEVERALREARLDVRIEESEASTYRRLYRNTKG